MDIENLRKKYGENKVMVLPNSLMFEIFPEISNCQENLIPIDNMENRISEINTKANFLLRYEAELNTEYKQPIPYIILLDANKIFLMERIGGDSRLLGMGSIGLGGHVELDENIEQALQRELKEEIGISLDELSDIKCIGIIKDFSNEVGAVHIGLLYIAKLKKNTVKDIKCLEYDKLTGKFVNIDIIEQKNKDNLLETWSKFAFEQYLKKYDKNK